MKKRIAVIGGGGARTPLLVAGLAEAQDVLETDEIALFDVDRQSAETMAALCREVVARVGTSVSITAPRSVEQTVEGARFVVSSIRVGGIAARARDERVIIDNGYVGQETTGPGGLAMALRTIPVALEHARVVERLAPEAWLINFTNPAGLITQALRQHTRTRVVGICDTPAELFHRIAWSLGLPFEAMDFDYIGLNHLGFVRRVSLDGEDITSRLLASDENLLRLYPARLFEPEMIRALRLIPTEYLFFYWAASGALRNQLAAGASRGEEIAQMNRDLFENLRRAPDAIQAYKDYLNGRNASYMKLEGNAESGLQQAAHDWDPFQGATGYHRIAVEVMTALAGRAAQVVVNVTNGDAMPDLHPDDVVEVRSAIDVNGVRPLQAGALPDSVKGLVLAVKEYERLAIRAAVEQSFELACLALFTNPIVGEWGPAVRLLTALAEADPESPAYLRGAPSAAVL